MYNDIKSKMNTKDKYELTPILIETIKQLSPEDLEDLKKNKHFENVLDLIKLRYEQYVVIAEARNLLR